MKDLFICIFAVLVFSCTNNNKIPKTSEPQNIISNIKFNSSELQFDSIANAFYSQTRNPKWNANANTFPFFYKGYGFDNVRGIFSKENTLIGLVLRSYFQNKNVYPSDNLTILEKEYGKPIKVHQDPTPNDVKAKGEYPNKLWYKNGVSVLLTYSIDTNGYDIIMHTYIFNHLYFGLNKSNSIDEVLATIKKYM